MRVLVTGGSGHLGVPLVRALLRGTEHHVRLFGRRDPRLPANERVTWSAGDVRRKEDVAAAAAGAGAILHLAGLTHSNRPGEYDAINLGGTRNVVEAARAGRVRRLVFFSSWVASAEGGGYARSKLLAEEEVRRSGVGWVILRPAEVYGAGQGGALPALLERVRAKRLVPIPGHGRYRMSPLYIDDLVTAVLAVLARPDVTGKVYTLAGPEVLTLNELVDRAAAFHRAHPVRVRVPLALIRLAALAARAAGRDRPALDQVARLRVERDADTTEARRDLGFRPRTLEEGLAALFSPDPG